MVNNANEPISKWSYRSKQIRIHPQQTIIFGHHLTNPEKHITRLDDELYLFGNYGNPKSIHGSYQTLAKTRIGSLLNLDFSDIKLWSDKNRWTKPSLQSIPGSLFQPAARTIDRLQQAACAFVIDGTYLSIRTAYSITGPWTLSKVFEMDFQPSTHIAYAAKVHPELTVSDNEIVVSFMINSRSGLPNLHERYYFPHFVRVNIYSNILGMPNRRPNCQDCRHLPTNPKIYGHYAGVYCPCLNEFATKPLFLYFLVAKFLNPTPAANTDTFVSFPDGPLDVLPVPEDSKLHTPSST